MNTDMSIKYYGVYSLPYGQIPEYRDMLFQLNRLYNDRIAQVPWIPKEWAAYVLPSLTGRSGDIEVIAPATASYYDTDTGTRKYGARFLDTDEKKAWWNDLARSTSGIISAYAAGQVAEGRKLMEAAYQNTERWNNAIKFVDLLAAPVHIITDAADTYQKYKSVISGLVIFGGLGLGLYLFTRR